MRATLLLVLLLAAPVVAFAQTQAAKGAAPTTALLVIDIQEFYFPGGKLPLVGPEAASARARALLDAFRQRSWPVIHVQHLPKSVAEPSAVTVDPQYRIHGNVLPLAGETLIGKHEANAFRDTRLLEVLRALGVKNLVVCGMQTHMCVEATTRAAADLGFDVTVAHDACATRPLSFGGVDVPAAQVHAAALAAMQQGGYARVTTVGDYLAEGR